MSNDGFKAAAVAALILCGGIAGAQAYEQFNNATVALADGKLANLDSVASSYCQAKGFQGAEQYAFAGFTSNTGRATAVFSQVRCTMVANVQPTSNIAKGKDGGFQLIYNSDATHAIADAVKTQAVKNSISNSISHGYQVNSGSGGGHVSSPGSLCCH